MCCLYNKGARSLPSVLSISGPSIPYSSTPWQSTCKEDEFCQSSLNMGRLEFRNARILAVGILFLFIVLLSLIVARPIEKHPSLPTLADQSGFQDHPEHFGPSEWRQACLDKETKFSWSGNGTPVRCSVLWLLGTPQLSETSESRAGGSQLLPAHVALSHASYSSMCLFIILRSMMFPTQGKMCHKGETSPVG